MNRVPQVLFRLVWPEGIAALAGVVFVAWPVARAAAQPFLPVYPYVVLVAGLLVGWRFGRGRLVLAVICLAAAERALTHLHLEPLQSHAVAEMVAVLLPANLAALAFIPEVGPTSRAARLATLLLGAEIIVVAVAGYVAAAPIAYGLALPLFPIAGLDRLAVPQTGIVVCVAACVLAGWRATHEGDSTARGLLWATIASLIAFNASLQNQTLFFSAAGLAVLFAMVEAAYALAFQDELTALPGRRAFNQALASLSGSYIVAMVDVDYFKQFNDRYGHDVGDQVLKLVADRLRAIGGGGKAYRHGGEEFAVLFSGAALDATAEHLESLRKEVEASTFTLRGANRPKQADASQRGREPRRRDISVTVSIGAASADRQGPAATLKAADRALYRAKETGRNRLVSD